MGFEGQQIRKLRAKLRPRHVRSRLVEGTELHYLEGWHVIAEANRIFGFDGWDRETVETKREVALAVMEETGIEKLCEPDFTVSLRISPPGVVITSEEDIPEWFWIPQDPKLDKRAILEAIKAGTAVAGAELSNTKVSLSVRTK